MPKHASSPWPDHAQALAPASPGRPAKALDSVTAPRAAGDADPFIQREEPIATHWQHIEQIRLDFWTLGKGGTDKDQPLLHGLRQMPATAFGAYLPGEAAPHIVRADRDFLRFGAHG